MILPLIYSSTDIFFNVEDIYSWLYRCYIGVFQKKNGSFLTLRKEWFVSEEPLRTMVRSRIKEPLSRNEPFFYSGAVLLRTWKDASSFSLSCFERKNRSS